MAQFAVLIKTNRQGTYTSASIDVPANITGLIKLTTDMLKPVLSDPANALSFNFEYSNDGGQTWVYGGGVSWRGGDYLDPEGNPAVNPAVIIPATLFAGKKVRAVVDIPATISTGLIIETL